MRAGLLRRVAVWLVPLALMPPVAVATQQQRPDAPGQWRYAVVNRAAPESGVTASQVDAFLENLALAGIPFRQSSALFRPRGIAVVPQLSVLATPGDPVAAAHRPLAGEFRLQLFPLYADCDRCPPKVSTVSTSIRVWANLPEAAYAGSDAAVFAEDESGPMYLAPLPAGKIGTYPEYRVNQTGRRYVVIAASSRPIWLPVTYERVLRDELSKAREQLASFEAASGGGSAYQEWLAGKEQRKREREEMLQGMIAMMPQEAERYRTLGEEMERTEEQVGEQLKAGEGADVGQRDQMRAELQRTVSAAEAQLNSLSPATRVAPVYVGPDGTRLPPAASRPSGAMAVVAPNPNFFDAKLPRTAIQVLVVESEVGDRPPFGPLLTKRLRQIRGTVDWNLFSRALLR